jgi:hypothetical protein
MYIISTIECTHIMNAKIILCQIQKNNIIPRLNLKF